MVRETEVVSLRVDPETRKLLEKTADRRGLSLAALLLQFAENAVSPPSRFERWADEVEHAIDCLSDIGGTDELLELGPRSLEGNIIQIESDLDELLSEIVEAGDLGEQDEDEEEE